MTIERIPIERAPRSPEIDSVTERIAPVVHDVLRVYERVIGFPLDELKRSWDDASKWAEGERNSSRERVAYALTAPTEEQRRARWAAEWHNAGWPHPYSELPPYVCAKDEIAFAIVRAMVEHGALPPPDAEPR